MAELVYEDDAPDPFEPLLSSDFSRAVQGDYAEIDAVGADAEQTTAAVFARYRDLLNDPVEGPVVLLTLAVLQHRSGRVLPAVRDAAVDLIDSGEAAGAGNTLTDTTTRRARDELLQTLRDLLAPDRPASD
jgi:hypothetical protein